MTPSPAHRLTTTSLHAAINAVWPVERWDQVWTVLGCSGGADSVALVRAMHGMSRQRRLVIAHYDHGLRGRQSRADAEFVQQLAANLGLEFRLGRRDTEGANRESEFASDEQSLRTLRYDFLVRVARQHGARYVSVAHNRDDSVESVLHALLRGTGPAGLCGIPMFRDLSGSDQSTQDSDLILARPLLNIGGEQLRQWLTDQEYHHREDSSNQDTHYTRNWIRHRLLPTIIERFPSAIESVDRAISLQRDWAEVVGEQRDAFAAAHVLRVDYDGESQFVIQCTRAYPAAVIIDAMRMAFQDASWSRSRMDQAHWRRLASWIRDEQVEKDSLVRSAASNDVEKPSHPKRPSQSEKSIDLGTLPGKIRVIRRGTSIHLQRDV